MERRTVRGRMGDEDKNLVCKILINKRQKIFDANSTSTMKGYTVW